MRYQTAASRWEGLKAVALTGMAIGTVTRIEGDLSAEGFLVILALGGAVLVVSIVGMRRTDRSFIDGMVGLLNDLERLKGRRSHG